MRKDLLYATSKIKRPLRTAWCLLLVIVVMVTIGGVSSSYAAGPTAGQELRAMGLIEGKAGGDLAEDEYLTRTEMMVVLARMLGEFNQAAAWNMPSTFTDRRNHWGEPYVAYAQSREWTSGVGGNLFGYEQRHTVQEASVFMLKALGYTTPEDFAWETAFDTAASLGLFKGLSLNQEQDILRGDLFKLMMNTLETQAKGHPYKLGEQLGVLVSPTFAEPMAAARANQPFAAVRIGDRWGYMGPDGKLAIRFLYSRASDFSENLAVVSMNGKYGFIDKAGTMMIPFAYEDAGSFADGLAPAKYSGKYGYIDKNANWVIEPAYEFADQFSEGLARVVVSGKIGYIDTTGTMVIQPAFTAANRFENGIAAIQENGLTGYINRQGTKFIPPQYLIAGNGADGLIRYNSGTSIGFLNTSGAPVLSASYMWADNFSEGLAVIETDASGGFAFRYINTSGQRVFSQSYQDAHAFSEGLAFVMSGGKYGIIDKSGAMVVQPKFNYVDPEGFSEGFARIKSKDLTGFINRSGVVVISPQFDEARRFVK
ncbi:WG repeat-containing protein [Acidaminobacter hydrogenoformans]|uniref:WG containing repeat-containing protein n=1 Tax=Acidaminobacter hydrogenoformans DSM 2784 TaxID=1120920 RepID=A0A1G5S634_9FIRM|nr:WG repeat-containing protein [Acidaminobacter hydrogenoformans]SCZ81872.1 WG containing repeat-containing protein [Acidaminobacter hydrogenoformans DSM 2784]